jgi:hypothetical protein
MDATFTSQFGSAVQSEILRQAAQDRQGRLADSEGVTPGPIHPASAVNRVLGALRRRAARSRGSMPVGTNMTARPCCSLECACD